MRGFTIYHRFLIGFGITTILFLLSTLYSGIILQKLSASANVERRAVRDNQRAYELEIEVLRGIIVLTEVANDINDADTSLLPRIHASTQAIARRMRHPAQDSIVVRELNNFDRLFPLRWALADSIVAAARASAPEATIEALRERRNELDLRARHSLTAIVAAEQEQLLRSIDHDDRLRRQAQARVIFLWAVNLGVVLLFAWWLPSFVRGKLRPLFEVTRKLRNGDYTSRAPVRGNDELDRLARNFNAMAAQLEELDQVKSDFLALASHQLRTPATGVKANIGMLIEGYCGELTEEQQQVLGDAYDSNERQLAIIDDMLAVARVESGKLTLVPERLDLVAMLQNVVAEQHGEIARREQTVALSCPPGQLTMHADPQRLRMVFENLVSNASKYSFTGGEIRILVDRDGDRAVVSVSDDGVGIEEKDLHKLYKKFSRVDNPLSRSVSGTGLGLYLAYEIVRLHGGAITAQSAPGKGTTFTVRLPIGETA